MVGEHKDDVEKDEKRREKNVSVRSDNPQQKEKENGLSFVGKEKLISMPIIISLPIMIKYISPHGIVHSKAHAQEIREKNLCGGGDGKWIVLLEGK